MKKFFFVALLGLTIAACSKKTTDAVTPDNASKVAGVYTLNYVRYDSAAVPLFGPFTLPYAPNGATLASGTITATKVTSDSVKIDVHLVISGAADQNYSYGNFYLTSSGASYNLTYGTTASPLQAGTIDGKTLNIDVTYPDYYNPKVNDRDVLIGLK